MCHVNVCVGAAQQQQRAGQWVRSCVALAPITPPSVHQHSLSFCSPFYPLHPTPCVFIRLVGALSTVTLLLILMVMTAESPPSSRLTPGSDLESPTPGFCCYRTHYYQAMMSAFCQWTQTWIVASDCFCPNIIPHSLFSFSPSLPFSSSPGWLHVWVSLELVCF